MKYGGPSAASELMSAAKKALQHAEIFKIFSILKFWTELAQLNFHESDSALPLRLPHSEYSNLRDELILSKQ